MPGHLPSPVGHDCSYPAVTEHLYVSTYPMPSPPFGYALKFREELINGFCPMWTHPVKIAVRRPISYRVGTSLAVPWGAVFARTMLSARAVRRYSTRRPDRHDVASPLRRRIPRC